MKTFRVHFGWGDPPTIPVFLPHAGDVLLMLDKTTFESVKHVHKAKIMSMSTKPCTGTESSSRQLRSQIEMSTYEWYNLGM